MNPLPFTVGMRGFFKFESVNPITGRRLTLLDWTPNAILDAGRNIMATSSNWAGAGSKCQVGTDSTTADHLQTQLLGYIAGTDNIVEHTWGAQSTPPYYGWDRTTYRFAVGTTGGNNLNEVGIGWDTAFGPYLISRSRLLDEFGAEVTVTPLLDEYLDVTYELRYYPPLDDVLGTITLDGVVYDTTTRAASVTGWGGNIGLALGQYSVFASDWRAYSGDIGAITGVPSGFAADCDNADQYNLSYASNSYEIGMVCDCGGTGWNVSGGIRSIRIKTTAGDFQTMFRAQGTDAPIPKTSGYQMQLIYTLGWTPAVIP